MEVGGSGAEGDGVPLLVALPAPANRLLAMMPMPAGAAEEEVVEGGRSFSLELLPWPCPSLIGAIALVSPLTGATTALVADALAAAEDGDEEDEEDEEVPDLSGWTTPVFEGSADKAMPRGAEELFDAKGVGTLLDKSPPEEIRTKGAGAGSEGDEDEDEEAPPAAGALTMRASSTVGFASSLFKVRENSHNTSRSGE